MNLQLGKPRQENIENLKKKKKLYICIATFFKSVGSVVSLQNSKTKL